MKKVFPLCILLGLQWVLLAPAFCDPPSKGVSSWVVPPSLTLRTSRGALEKIVQSLQKRGFIITNRHQQFNKAGEMVAFHCRTTFSQSKGVLNVSDLPAVAIEVSWTPEKSSTDFVINLNGGAFSTTTQSTKASIPAPPAPPAPPGG